MTRYTNLGKKKFVSADERFEVTPLQPQKKAGGSQNDSGSGGSPGEGASDTRRHQQNHGKGKNNRNFDSELLDLARS